MNNKYAMFLLLAIVSSVFTEVQAQFVCSGTVNYRMTNNSPDELFLRVATQSQQILSMPNRLATSKEAVITVCKGTKTENPAITVSNIQNIAQRVVSYRFMFKPLLFSGGFAGEIYNSRYSFSWTNTNRHIFLCKTKQYLSHGGTCNF